MQESEEIEIVYQIDWVDALVCLLIGWFLCTQFHEPVKECPVYIPCPSCEEKVSGGGGGSGATLVLEEPGSVGEFYISKEDRPGFYPISGGGGGAPFPTTLGTVTASIVYYPTGG